ncbi:MAG: SMI1/KNR4 family protein [Pirellulales bacterium]
MDQMTSEVIELLHQSRLPPGDTIPEGVSEDDIIGFEKRTGLKVPPRLRSWLRTSNGPCAGAGGVYGIHPKRHDLDIEYTLGLRPVWIELGWIPIAGDGCGNEYCVVTRNEFGDGEPVIFIETLEGENTPTYVVASETWHFLRFYFKADLGLTEWPFDKNEVVNSDPNIAKFNSATLPWDA